MVFTLFTLRSFALYNVTVDIGLEDIKASYYF